MKNKSIKLFGAISIALVTTALQTAAVSFDFYKLSSPIGGSDFLPINGSSQSGDIVSAKNGDLSFTIGSLTATVTSGYSGGKGNSWVVQDHQNGWTLDSSAGLGVYHKNPFRDDKRDLSDDNVTVNEWLTVTFNEIVNITSIGLRAEGHNIWNWIDGSTLLIDGVSTLLPKNVSGGLLNLDLTGTSFTFAYGGEKPDQFYLASIEASAVPDGGTTFALFGIALVGLGCFRKQRSKK